MYSIAALRVQRMRDRTYSFVIPTLWDTSHQQAKLRRWGLAILLSAPRLDIGKSLLVRQDVQPHHLPRLTQVYAWEYTAPVAFAERLWDPTRARVERSVWRKTVMVSIDI